MKALHLLFLFFAPLTAASLITFTAINGTADPTFQALTGTDILQLNNLVVTLGTNENSVQLLVNGQVEGLTDCAPICTFSRLAIDIPAHSSDTIVLSGLT